MTVSTVTPAPACPVCGARKRDPLFVKNGWPVVRCPACTLVYVDASIDRRTLDALYGREYFEGDAFQDYIAEAQTRLASARGRTKVLARIVPGGHLLDVGCAAGFFLRAASEHYAVSGVELSEFAARHAREELGVRVFTGDIFDAPLDDEEFDVVTMWDVVEHLPNPAAVMAEVARVTRRGGLLVLATGNVDGPLARRDLQHWDLMHPPGHLTFFSPRTLGHLVTQSGFELQRLVCDGRLAPRPRLADPRVQAVAGALGFGNVMTIFARRVTSPRHRPLAARVPQPLRRPPARLHGRPEPASDAEWLEIATRCPYATFFHTPMWRDLALHGMGGCRDASFLLRLPTGVRAVFPLQELLPRRTTTRHLLSTYPYGFGGPVADGTLDASDIRALYAHAHAASSQITGNPLMHEPPPLRGWTRRELSTQMLDLSEGWEVLKRRFSKGHRAAIKQAERKGVTVRIASGVDDYEAYYRVYEDSLRRWGDAAGPRYPWSLFATGLRIQERVPGTIRLWLAEHDTEVVSGAWVFCWNHHAMYWHAATLERAFGLRPANLVLATAIEDAIGRGYAHFDFGSSGGHEGPAAFKRRFGATERPVSWLSYITPALRLTGALRRRFAARSSTTGRSA